MAGTLATIEPVHAPLVPPKGDDGKAAVPIGHTPDGRLIYTRTIIRPAKQKVPKLDPVTGEQEWARHPTTGEKLYSRWRTVREERTQTFTLESDGANNVYVQEYHPPTPEQIAKAERDRRIEENRARLDEMMADEDFSPEDLFKALKARKGNKAG